MANYFVIGNNFKPFSYEELIKPYKDYGEAYKEQENALGELNQQANALAAALSKENDPVAWATYNKYLTDVKNAADTIATSGLSNATRQGVKDLTSRYAGEITPIQNAYNRRLQLQDEQRKAYLANPTVMFERDFNKPGEVASLDRFVANPNYDYGRVYTGSQLEADVSKAAKALSVQLRDPSAEGQNLRDELKKILPGQYRLLEERGFNDTEVLDAIMKNPNASPILTKIVDDVITSSGMRGWENYGELQNRIYDAASRGLWSAVGQDSFHYLNTNTGGGGNSPRGGGRGYPIDTTSYYFGGKGRGTNVGRYLSNDGKLDNTIADSLFDESGKIRSKKDFVGKYQTLSAQRSRGLASVNPGLGYSEYDNIINALRSEGYSDNKIARMSRGDLESALARIYNNEQDDVIGHALFRQRLDDTTSKYLQEEINKQGVPLERVTGITFDENGKAVAHKTKTDKKVKIDSANILFDPRLNQFLIQSGGEFYKMPNGILSTEGTMDSTEDARRYNSIMDTMDNIEEKLYKAENGVINLSPRERRELETRYMRAQEALQDVNMRLGNYGYEFVDYVGKHKVNGS
jgi:hypothetical protein